MKTIRDRVKELRNTSPNMPAIVIARQIGVSRERVRQILTKLKLPTDLRTPTLCNKCGKKLHGRISKLCWTCYVEDYHKHHTTELVCPRCGKQFTRENSEINCKLKLGRKLFFCSPSCRSLSMWETRNEKKT